MASTTTRMLDFCQQQRQSNHHCPHCALAPHTPAQKGSAAAAPTAVPLQSPTATTPSPLLHARRSSRDALDVDTHATDDRISAYQQRTPFRSSGLYRPVSGPVLASAQHSHSHPHQHQHLASMSTFPQQVATADDTPARRPSRILQRHNSGSGLFHNTLASMLSPSSRKSNKVLPGGAPACVADFSLAPQAPTAGTPTPASIRDAQVSAALERLSKLQIESGATADPRTSQRKGRWLELRRSHRCLPS